MAVRAHSVTRTHAFVQMLTFEESGLAPLGPGWSSQTLGLACVVLSALLWSVHGLLVTVSSRSGFTVLQLSFYVGVTRLLIALVCVPLRREWRQAAVCTGFNRSLLQLVAFREVAACCSLVAVYKAYALMPLGQATSLICTTPIWTAIMGHVWLGEAVTTFKAAAVLFAVVGVVLVAGDETGEGAGKAMSFERGAGFAVLGALLLALVTASTRKIGHRVPAMVLIGVYGLMLAAGCAAASLANGTPLRPGEGIGGGVWVLMLASTVVAFFAQILVTLALQRVEAARVNVVAMIEIAFSFGWQASVLGRELRAVSLLGAFLVFASAAAVVREVPQAAPAAAEASASAISPFVVASHPRSPGSGGVEGCASPKPTSGAPVRPLHDASELLEPGQNASQLTRI